MASSLPSTTTTEMLQDVERRARRFWVSIIVGLLSLQVLGGVIAVYLASSDPTVAVIPNYYQAGLDWDVKHRNLDQFLVLGWKTEVLISDQDTELNQRTIEVHVRDRNDQPVPNLRVSAKVYHHAKGAEIHSMTLDQTHPGVYVALTRLTQAGLWQVDLYLEGDHGIAENRMIVTVKAGESTLEIRNP